MSEQNVVDMILTAKEQAQAGVDYSPRYGAVCPCCKTVKIPIFRTMPWDGNTRIRYHKCKNTDCLLSRLNLSVKSLQEDVTNVESGLNP